MKRQRAKLILTLLALGVLVVAGIWYVNREPEYHGRKLSAWVADLKSDDIASREAAAEVVKAMGPEAVPYLAGTLDSRGKILQRLNAGIGQHIPEKVKQPLRRVFGFNGDTAQKHAAAEALRLIGTNAQEAIPALSETLSGDHLLLSSVASQALAEIGPSAVPSLVQALDAPAYNVRAHACAALGKLGTNSAPAIPRLVRVLENETGPIVPTAAYTLGRIGPASVPALLPLLSHTNWLVRRWTVYSLNYTYPPTSEPLPHLIEVLKRDPHPEVRMLATHAVSKLGLFTPEGIEALLAALQDASTNVQAAAVSALGQHHRVVIANRNLFVEMLDHPSADIRANAIYALQGIGEHAVDILPRIEPLTQDKNYIVRRRAEDAMTYILASANEQKRRD